MAWRQLGPGKYVYRTTNDFVLFGVNRNGRWHLSKPIPFEVGEDIDVQEFLSGATRQDLLAFANWLKVYESFDTLAEAQQVAAGYIAYIESDGLKFARCWLDYAPTRFAQWISDRLGGA